MCLITPDKQLYIAVEDIIVYKILDSNLSPYHYGGKPYELGELNVTEMLPSTSPKFPSWNAMDWINQRLDEWELKHVDEALRSDKFLQIGQGFHYYDDINNNNISLALLQDKGILRYKVVECTIPKGAEYHKSPYGLGVSNKLIINKIIK